MAVYYNEIDGAKAEWLRENIKANLIAPGEVDERSICDVQPEDLRGFTQCHFFAGVGIWSYALRLAGWPDSRPVWTGSCPCQPFSVSGKRVGGLKMRGDAHLARSPEPRKGRELVTLCGAVVPDAELVPLGPEIQSPKDLPRLCRKCREMAGSDRYEFALRPAGEIRDED